MQNLTQRTWFSRKEIWIQENRLLIQSRNFREDLEYSIKFEELGFEIVKKKIKTANIPFFFLLLIDASCLGLLVVECVRGDSIADRLLSVGACLFFSLVTFIAYLNRNREVIFLTGGNKVLELSQHRPDPETVDAFVELVHGAIRLYYKVKYAKIDQDVSLDMMLTRFHWLREIQAISDTEYRLLVEELKAYSTIGFRKN